MSVRVWLEGQVYEDETGKFETLLDTNLRARLIDEGTFLLPDMSPMEAVAQRRMRAFIAQKDSLKGVSDSFVEDMDFQPDEPRWVIPGLWRWGTIPMLSGQPKAGKSTLAVELTAALTTPGARFLDHFEPSEMSLDAEVWYINAETPIADFQELIYDAGAYGEFLGDDDRRVLRVEHLEVMGGPSIFDLTVPANYDLWASHFIDCIECYDTGEFAAPSVVIVDGLTAILGGTTDRYGQWYAKFRQLLRSVDVPNGLVIGHSTMTGTHSMGGTEALAGPDGLWTFTSNSKGRRLFSVLPRMGGIPIPPTAIALGDDGRSRVAGSASPAVGTTEAITDAGSPVIEPIANRVLGCVAARQADGKETRRADVRAGVGGDFAKVDAALAQLLESGQVVIEKRKAPSGQTFNHHRIGQEPDEPIDGGKASK
jgi:hypothetical protein